MSFENEDNFAFNYDEEERHENPEGGEEIGIQIKKENGDMVYYEINTNDTVKSLIDRYREDVGIQGGTNIKLSMRAKMFDENKTFKDYGVVSNDTLDVYVRLHGGMKYMK